MRHKPQITPKQDLPDPPETVDPHDPEWALPPPPEFGARAWFMMILERFGFWIACALTITAIAYLYINADRIRHTDRAPNSVVGAEQGTPTHDQGRLAEAMSVPAEEADTSAAHGIPIFITTDPAGAALFVNGDYVGVSPLRYAFRTEGRHLISVLKPDYTQRDTLVTFNEASTLLHVTLREADDVILAEASEQTPPETPSATDEANRAETPTTSPTPALVPASTPDAAQAAQEQTTPARDVGETRAEEEPPDDQPLAVAETEEEPAVQVGDLQVNSEPSGASVSVAGVAVGVTPLLLADVPVGAQPITLRLDGYEDFATTVDIVAEQQSTVNGQLKQRLGTLRILVKPWGTIYIDGTLHKEESTIWYVAKLPPGNHRVRVEHPSLGTWEQVVAVSANEERSVTIDYNKSDSGGQ